MRNSLYVALTIVLTAALPVAAQEKVAVKVLIITGDHGHDWRKTTPFLAAAVGLLDRQSKFLHRFEAEAVHAVFGGDIVGERVESAFGANGVKISAAPKPTLFASSD